MKTIILTDDEVNVLTDLLQFRIEELKELGDELDQLDVLHSILDKVE